MDNDLFLRVAYYNASMAMVRIMLREGLISEEEYSQIDRNIANKFSLDLSVIYR